MKCTKCNHALPADSEFCQYCGIRIEKAAMLPVAELNIDPIPAPVPVLQKEKTATSFIPQNEKTVKLKYCSKCGSVINGNTKKCTGCGKQYFRGLRITKFSATVIVLAFVIIAISTLCVLQHLKTQEMDSTNQVNVEKLESKIRILEQKVKNKDSVIRSRDSTIEELEGKIDVLEDENWENWYKLEFFDNHAEIVPDDGTKMYHKYDCAKLDTSDGFWIFNSEAAEGRGYKKCSRCH